MNFTSIIHARYLLTNLILLAIPVICLAQSSILIQDVNVIPMTSVTIISHQDVRIENGRIVSVENHNPQSKADLIIDGADRYLMPGLSEMHAHIPVAQEGDDELVRETLFLYLANGITTIRGMLGDPYHLQLKKQVESFTFPGPRIYSSSPSLNGNTITTPEEARQKVTQYKNDGYDFLKIHPGIKLAVFDEMAKTAKEVGITFSGHVPLEVGIEHAIASGYATIDHLDGYVEGLVSPELRDQGGFFGILLADQADEQKIYGLISATKEMGISIVPTQSLMTRWLSPKAPELMVQEPEMIYVSPAQRFGWRQGKQQMLDQLNYSEDLYDHFIAIRKKYLHLMMASGIPILLGSDAPQVFNVPGFSIHHEMESMVEAGLNNFQVLASGTVNVANFFEAADRGTIEEGQVADLVLLNDNPLSDIINAQKIEAVIYRGKLLSQYDIKAGLQKIATKYNSN